MFPVIPLAKEALMGLRTKQWTILSLTGFLITGVIVAADPLQLATARQVFIDGRFLAASQNVELVVNRPQVTGDI